MIMWELLFQVRSTEYGTLGSWHTGTVIACKKNFRRVMYDQLLHDDGSGKLVEDIIASSSIDGRGLDCKAPGYRGWIRPVPPQVEFGKWSLNYGLCVDANYNDAWWEGVVFDHEDGMESRRVFFPDLGDELMISADKLRISQDWDELTDEWRPRGNWILLELIEKFQEEWPIDVSVKQIWYDVRVKEGFSEVKEWTCFEEALWKDLVLEVVKDYFEISSHEIFSLLDLPEDFFEETQAVYALDEPACCFGFEPEVDSGKRGAILPVHEMLQSETNIAANGEENVMGDGECISIIDNIAHTKCELSAGQRIERKFVSVHDMLQSDANIAVNGEENAMGVGECNAIIDNMAHTKCEFSTGQLIEAKFERDWPNGVVEDDYLSINLLTDVCPSSSDDQSNLQPAALAVLPTESVSLASPSPSIAGLCTTSCSRPNKIRKCSKGGESQEWLGVGIDRLPGAEFCPDAVTEYVLMHDAKKKPGRPLTTNVRKHLAYLGWKIESRRDGTQMRYTSPDGNIYYSLLQVCQDLRGPMVGISAQISEGDQETLFSGSDKIKPLPAASKSLVIEPSYCPQAVVDWYLYELNKTRINRSSHRNKDIRAKARNHLAILGWKFNYVKKSNSREELRYISPEGKTYFSLCTACKCCIEEAGGIDALLKNEESMLQQNMMCDKFVVGVPGKQSIKVHGIEERSRRKKNRITHLMPASAKKERELGDQNAGLAGKQLGNSFTKCVLRSSKRARQVALPNSSPSNPRTILSWLIDNNVVLPRAKVHYRKKRDSSSLREGRVTREGIKCSCCQKVFTLSKFELHAGSTIHRPSAHIFLEDGRSLLECQMQMHGNRMRCGTTKPDKRMRGNQQQHKNDHICSVCHYGGHLLLCDHCPSSFHKSCLNMKEVPEGDWFCPACCCGICGQSYFDVDAEHFSDDSVLTCDQCEHKYHAGCLRKQRLTKLQSSPKGNWFCCNKCQKIFNGLHKLLGKPIPVDANNLTWTMLKSMKYDGDSLNPQILEKVTMINSKLNVALSVMHECFEPVKDPRTRSDLVEDVIFSRGSELNRLNFKGFYTVLLEKNDELISAATVRQNLIELGVERLVLPAVPGVLNTWTNSFGFSRMTDSERFKFLDYTFLDFQDTVMCQKLLTKAPLANLSLPRGTNHVAYDDFKGVTDDNDLNEHNPISEVFQVEQKSESLEDRPKDVVEHEGGDGAASMIEVTEPNHVEFESDHGKRSLDCLAEDADNSNTDNETCGSFLRYVTIGKWIQLHGPGLAFLSPSKDVDVRI
ncbi:Tify domain binding domain [Dillenia turbinata]|uniref:Tify domain binding domain n=1 Tax=Dillenia turbinata TaxID=194707 RepID=A0AAN8V267_9MAGN